MEHRIWIILVLFHFRQVDIDKVIQVSVLEVFLLVPHFVFKVAADISEDFLCFVDSKGPSKETDECREEE